MREIKFRAWDKKEKKMISFSDINVLIGDYGCSLEKAFELARRGDYLRKDQIKLMQYTGLKDKDGKEVYEGDIIKAWGGMNSETKVFPVEYTNSSAYQNSYAGYKILCDIWFSGDGCEVIGNIYENPELLTVSEDK